MLEPARTAALFADARLLYDEAIELLDLGKLRIAAEAAWGATKRATDALIVARTGREPRGTGQTSSGLRILGHETPEIQAIRDQFREAVRELHGKCFYRGICEPMEAVSELIRATADYIQDATILADS